MRLLIVDDQVRRYARLVDRLIAVGFSRDQVDIVPCANDARTKLEAGQYALLLLDILLPLWPEDEPDVQNALDLLVEVHEGMFSQSPHQIIGITGNREVTKEAASSFEERTWTVVDYSESDDGWIEKIINCIVYMRDTSLNSASVRNSMCDLAIICALEKPELEEVLKLPWHWSAPRPIDDITFVSDGYFLLEEQKITVCATAAPRMGMVSTALIAANVIALLRPRLIAMCGICAGIKGKVGIGDVLLADPAWDFQSGKRVRDKENTQFSMAPHMLYTPTLIRSHVEQVRSDREALAKIPIEFGSDAPGLTRVVVGPVASGSAVLADGEVVQEVRQQHRELIGIEMEAYGLYAAAHAASNPQPLAFALKGVCDFADPDKEDKNQRYAAFASASVLRLLMENFGNRLLGRT